MIGEVKNKTHAAFMWSSELGVFPGWKMHIKHTSGENSFGTEIS